MVKGPGSSPRLRSSYYIGKKRIKVIGATSLKNRVKSLELPGFHTIRMWNNPGETECPSYTARPTPFPLASLTLHRWMLGHRSSNTGKLGFTGEHRVCQLTTHTFMPCCHCPKIFKSAATQRAYVSVKAPLLWIEGFMRTGTRVVQQLALISLLLMNIRNLFLWSSAC